MATLNVLLLEGHHGVRTALARRLERLAGIELVDAVGDAEAAIACLARHPSTVVLCDPRSCSDAPVAVVHMLSRMAAAVVVLTTSVLDCDARAFRSAGAAAVLLKGCTTQEILATLHADRRYHV
jgi:DNA-binding NarL/FixJ family response regulator